MLSSFPFLSSPIGAKRKSSNSELKRKAEADGVIFAPNFVASIGHYTNNEAWHTTVAFTVTSASGLFAVGLQL
jgi:hypothetical protein